MARGLTGVYYYGRKSLADKATRSARRNGYNAHVERWLDRASDEPMWEVAVTRSRRLGSRAKRIAAGDTR